MRFFMEKRIISLFCVFILGFVFLSLRLGYIQLDQGSKLARQALARNTFFLAAEDYCRGDILDSSGMSLTGAVTVNRVAVFPGLIEDTGAAVSNLAGIFNKKKIYFTKYFSGAPCYIPVDVSREQASLVRQNTGAGIYILPFKCRYSSSSLACHVTGYPGKIPSLEVYREFESNSGKNYNYDDWIGITGIEKFYERYLKGDFAARQAFIPIDAVQRPVSREVAFRHVPDKNRYDVITTIDRHIQEAVQDVMDREVPSGAVVVMEPGSGNILASASCPGYNPDPEKMPGNNRQDGVFINRATSFYQPGSLFKIVLACAALEEGAAGPDTTFTCLGAEDSPVRCWYSPGHGEITLYEALINSCNPAFVQLGQKLGARTIIEYAHKMGLSDSRIIGFPENDETRQDWSAVAKPNNLANSSIGQGPVLTTPVQITAMMNIIASGGRYYRPRIIKKLSSPDSEISFPAASPEKVISTKTAGTLKEMLYGVTRKGVGRNAFLKNCGSSGKTGSAQVSSGGNENINAWFSGYFPSENPEYVITILVEDGKSGSESAAPVFKEIAQKLINLNK
ncbi:MAG: penicillin-binding protein 2 [Clostridiales bacterium]|nr:penicillin-binding protein 2 [Clostridiales bacterium]MCF8021126.1 penicillin-binding protein 2 [Clostridiales bacterium]